MPYSAPAGDIRFWLSVATDIDAEMAAGLHGDLTPDLLDAILDEAARFATDVIAPVNRDGDLGGATVSDGHVTTAKGWREVYQRWCEAGWSGLSAREEHGGQGLPLMLHSATQEMWTAASVAFSLCPILTTGAVEALEAHGTEEQKATYIPNMVSGRWTGTMNLTEPNAGSDLGAMTTRAVPADDGSYRIFGTKIYITYGEHDLAENIIHLVLARLPDAPLGSRGISLFVVPKFLVNGDGSLGPRNDLVAARLEHKIGIHASPTCEMRFGLKDGAIGWMVGKAHRGLEAMFTMMNNARLAVGIQGVGVAEASYQLALAYANDRRQGRAASYDGAGMAPIIHHLDVRRMLLRMRGLTDIGRALCLALAHAIDRSRIGSDAERLHWSARSALLTPVAKAFSTDCSVDIASLGIQVHGGMGFIEETGAAQHWRDSRILPIYEGTNGIQAIDLVIRKLPLSGGDIVRSYIEELHAITADATEQTAEIARAVSASLDDLTTATAFIHGALTTNRVSEVLAGASDYLRLFALAAGGAYHLKAAIMAVAGLGSQSHLLIARFVATHILPETAGLRASVVAGGSVLDGATPEFFNSQAI